jgi:hypothetical protein
MEHPLIGELNHLTTDELSAKISELNKKLSIVARTGNGHLCDQLRMALASYNAKYQEKLQQSYRDANTNFDDKINIQ